MQQNWVKIVRLHKITTPEQVNFHYQIAGLVTRAMAWSLDQLVLLLAIVVTGIACSRLGMGLEIALILAVKFVLDFGYHTYFEMRWVGQTPGKRAMGIRVISSRGGRLLFTDVLTRTLLRTVDNPGLVPFLGFVGGLVALVDPLHRRLGDLAADTIVVQDVRTALPEGVLTQRSRENTFRDDPVICGRVLARASRQERDLMVDLMLRRDSLEPAVRETIFHDAATYFRKRYQLPQDLEYLSDEQTVLNLALIVQGTRFTA